MQLTEDSCNDLTFVNAKTYAKISLFLSRQKHVIGTYLIHHNRSI